MLDPKSRSTDQCRWLLQRCQRTIINYELNMIDKDDCIYNLVYRLIGASRDGIQDCWVSATEQISEDFLADMRAYFEREIIPVDYMPYPATFIVNFNSQVEIETKKRELRQAYMDLYAHLKALLESGSA